MSAQREDNVAYETHDITKLKYLVPDQAMRQ